MKNDSEEEREETSLMLKEIFNYVATAITKDKHILENHKKFSNLDLKTSSEVLHWILFAFEGKRNKFRKAIRRSWDKYEEDIDEFLEEIWKENDKCKRDEKLFDLIRTFCENIRINEKSADVGESCKFASEMMLFFNSIEAIRTFVFKYCAKDIGEKKLQAMTMWDSFVQNCRIGTSQMKDLVQCELKLQQLIKLRIFMLEFIEQLDVSMRCPLCSKKFERPPSFHDSEYDVKHPLPKQGPTSTGLPFAQVYVEHKNKLHGSNPRKQFKRKGCYRCLSKKNKT